MRLGRSCAASRGCIHPVLAIRICQDKQEISTNAWQIGVKKKKVNASSLWPAADAFGTPPPPFRSPGLPECCDSVRLDVFQ